MHNLTPSQRALIVVGPALVPGALWSDHKRHCIPDRLVFWGAGRPGFAGEDETVRPDSWPDLDDKAKSCKNCSYD